MMLKHGLDLKSQKTPGIFLSWANDRGVYFEEFGKKMDVF